MKNKLILQTPCDIPFEQGQLIFHNPSIAEISLVGEELFFTGCQYLSFSKEILNKKDKNHLQEISNFEILMTIIKEDNELVGIETKRKIKQSIMSVFMLMLPDYKVVFLPMSIMFIKEDFQQGQKKEQKHYIDKDNFESFRDIVSTMFCLSLLKGKDVAKYNPGGPQAEALVQKFADRQKRLAKLKKKGDKEDISLLSQYISILSVGLGKDKNELIKYTTYQLFDEFFRFRAKESFGMYLDTKLAGARDIDDVEYWMGDIYSS